jgi:hypothetical protein
MAARLAAVLLPVRVATIFLGVLGAVGLMLAMTGLYGIVSYAANRRRFELGQFREILRPLPAAYHALFESPRELSSTDEPDSRTPVARCGYQRGTAEAFGKH